MKDRVIGLLACCAIITLVLLAGLAPDATYPNAAPPTIHLGGHKPTGGKPCYTCHGDSLPGCQTCHGAPPAKEVGHARHSR